MFLARQRGESQRGTLLAGMSTYAGQTFASLGMDSGSYTWSWGSGNTADSLMLNVISSSVPEPSTGFLAALGLIGLASRRRHRWIGGGAPPD
jgi:hypothetical protein